MSEKSSRTPSNDAFFYILLGAKLLCEPVCPSPTHAVNGVTIFLSCHKLNNLAVHRKFEKVSSSFIFTVFSLKSRLLLLGSFGLLMCPLLGFYGQFVLVSVGAIKSSVCTVQSMDGEWMELIMCMLLKIMVNYFK